MSAEQDKSVELAVALMKLGISQAGVHELLSYPHDVIERQLAFLPYRKARRPEAFLMQAIRNDYSPPKEFYYAQITTPHADHQSRLDEDPESPLGPLDARIGGYGTEGPLNSDA